MAVFQLQRPLFTRLHWGIPLCMVLLTAVGIVTIAGSELPTERHAARQALWLGVSLVAFALTVSLNPAWLRALAPVAYGALAVALVGLLVRGQTIKGSAAWYDLGPLRWQPSEMMKVATVLLLAEVMARWPGRMRSLWGLSVPLLITALPVALIFKQPDFGTAMVFLPVLGVMLWLGGARLRHLVLFALLAVAGAGTIYPHLKDYQRARLFAFANPGADIRGAGWNVHQAKITLGSGQLWGRAFSGEEDEEETLAPGQSRTKLDFLPEPHTDFIFSSLGEQFGFVGCALVLGLYVLMSLFAVVIALQASNLWGTLAVMGLQAIILTHVFLNVGMCLTLLPVTGLPLPYLSYGGSSLVTNFIIGGLICNVAARRWGDLGRPGLGH